MGTCEDFVAGVLGWDEDVKDESSQILKVYKKNEALFFIQI